MKNKELKKQNVLIKVLLSIFLMLGTFNLWTYYDPIAAMNIFGNLKTLEITNRLFTAVYILSVFITIVRIWKNTRSERKAKKLWTVLILILPVVFGVYYIWIAENKIFDSSK